MAGEEVDSRVDIYAPAITLYEALDGTRFVHGEYRELAAINQALPLAINKLIQECVAPRPAALVRKARPESTFAISGANATGRHTD